MRGNGLSGRTAVILGTRPEIIKMSSVIRALKKARARFFILHTGQHYSHLMDGVFFEELGLAKPDYNLNVGSGSHAEETAGMLVGIEKVLVKERASGVLVEGDTNTVLAGALAASKLGIKVGHVEAGLRSGDRRMPEELNRIVCDHLADALFAPTPSSRENLLREGISDSKITVTGNTVVDAVKQNVKLAAKAETRSFVSDKIDFLLATVHRQENVDDNSRLGKIIEGLERAGEATGLPVLYLAHPRSLKAIKRRGIRVNPTWLRITPPASYLQFLRLESRAKLVFTDSGGVQEEACILGVPCVTLRDNTERPETIEVGANVLAGAEPEAIVNRAKVMIGKTVGWRNPFGDGHASERIVESWARAAGK